MCMLIWHPEDAEPFTRAEFADFNRRNPHGWGVAWRQRGGLRFVKGRYDLDQQWKTYQRLRRNGHRALALHWRLATAGGREQSNCHPFVVNDVLVMHNGMLSHRSTKALSDTQCFIKDELADHLCSAVIQDERWAAWLERRIGGGNKMLLWGEETVEPVIIGEQRGVWYKGRWLSNTYAWTVPHDFYRRYRVEQPYLPSLSPTASKR